MTRLRHGVRVGLVLLLVFSMTTPLTMGRTPVQNSAPLPAQSTQQSSDNATQVGNLTIEQLALSNVTLTNTTIETLKIVNVTRDGESLTNRTMENVSAKTLTVKNAVLLNVSLDNVTIRNDSLAERLVGAVIPPNKSIGNATVEKLTLEGIVNLEDLTVHGVTIDSVEVANATLPNVIGKTEPVQKQANRTPALEVESATIVKFQGEVLGGRLQTKTTTPPATAQQANETTITTLGANYAGNR